MDPEETRAFAVSTTAELEVLRQAVALLMVRALKPSSPNEREQFLDNFEREVREMPPDYTSSDPEVMAFYEDVAQELPSRAASLARGIRKIMEP